MGEARLSVSVVVPAFNEERLLAGSLAAIRAAMAVFPDSELIVCDNNSSDRTAEIARAAGATVVFEPLNQISRARNTGAAHASGTWLLFVDADSYPSRELMAHALEAMRSGRYIGGGATVRLETDDRLVRLAIAGWNAMSRTMRWSSGAFLFCQADAFRRLGGFSTEFYAGEEIDLSRRLKRLGRFVVLHQYPLRTSARKAQLYTKREHFFFILKTLLLAGRPLRNRDACYVWYDGRR